MARVTVDERPLPTSSLKHFDVVLISDKATASNHQQVSISSYTSQGLQGALTVAVFCSASSPQTYTMPPKLQGQLSLFPAPHPPRIPSSVTAAREADARPKEDGTWRQYPYFNSGAEGSDKAVIFVGGLTNGLAGVPYTSKLSDELGKAGWKL